LCLKFIKCAIYPQPSPTPPPAAVPDFDVEEEFEDGDGEEPLEYTISNIVIFSKVINSTAINNL
jgi:hypothetical protein